MRKTQYTETYRIFEVGYKACQALYLIACAMVKTDEYECDSGEGVLEALLITLLHYWLTHDDLELYRAVECLKSEDEDAAIELQRLSKLDPADYPDLFDAIQCLKHDYPYFGGCIIDDVDLDDRKCLVRLTLLEYSPTGTVHPKMDIEKRRCRRE